MRPKTIVLFVVAVGCGLVASIGVSQYMQQASESEGLSAETASIFVAVTDIPIGEKLDAQNVKLEEWPIDRIPEGTISDLSDLEDRYPRSRLYVGEPILVAKLMDGNDRGSKAITIPPGYRVVSVNVSAESSVSGMVQPGDRVDLLVFLRKGDEIPETGTRTILKDVNIFSVDGETERQMDDESGRTFQMRTVSLLVKPEQAESVKLASELGRLSLSLRRPDDATDQSSDGETVHSLLGSDTEDPNDREQRSGKVSEDEGFIDWLSSQTPQSIPAPSQATETIVEEKPVWTMVMMTPDGSREFRWRDAEQLPEEVTQKPAVQPAVAPAMGSNPQGPMDGNVTTNGNMVGSGQSADVNDEQL